MDIKSQDATRPDVCKEKQDSFGIQLQGAKDAVWVAEVGLSCIEGNIAPIMVALEALTHVAGVVDGDLHKRIDAIQKLAKLGVRTVDDMVNTLDCEREGMQARLNALQGGRA